MIKKRDAVGKLFTPSGNFIILKWGFLTVGTEVCELHHDAELDIDYYPNCPGALTVQGDYVYKQFPQPKEIYICVDIEEENEK